MTRRTDRLNSLLKEVISDVVMREVKDPRLSRLFTITEVSITGDLHQAKVYVSVIGDEKAKKDTISALQAAAGFIAVQASSKVTMRYFPSLQFILDNSLEKQIQMENLIDQVKKERELREDHG